MPPHQRALRIQPQLRQPPQNRLKGDLAFQPSQRRPKTKMRGPPESQMLIVLARDVQHIGFWESFRIAIARAHDRDYSLALSNLLASEFDIGRSQPGSVLAGTFIPEQLLYCARNQR